MARIIGTAGSAPAAKATPKRTPRPVVQPNPDQRVPVKPAPHPPVSRPVRVTPHLAPQPSRRVAGPPVPVYVPPAALSSRPAQRVATQSRQTAAYSRFAAQTRRDDIAAQRQARQRAERLQRIPSPFTPHPISGMLGAERHAVASLAALHASNPAAYDARVRAAAHPGGGGGGSLLASIQPGALGAAVAHLGESYLGAIKHGDFGGMEVIPAAGRVVKHTAQDLGTLAVGPFVGGYELGDAAVTALRGHPGQAAHKLTGLAKGIVEPFKEQATHPIRYLSEHPLLSVLNVAGAESALGRTEGAVARGVGRKGASGVRGVLDEHAHVVRPPVSMTNDAGQPSLVQRTYSKDLTRRAAQVAHDRGREPLKDANGHVVTTTDRGRVVPVLKSTLNEQEKFGKQRGDFIAARTNAQERTVREQGRRAVKVSRRKGPSGPARDVVALAVQGALTGPAHFASDLRAYRDMVAKSIADHESGVRPYRDSGDLAAAQKNLELADRVLGSPKAMAQGPRILAEGTRIGGVLHAGDMENAAAELGSEQALRRSGLVVPAVTHMGARHFTVGEHQALERDAGKAEKAAADRYQAAKTPAERAQATADLHAAREHRIAVSGREPVAVRAHEDANAQLAVAQAHSKAAHAAEEAQTRKITALVARHRSERGREAHHGPVAAYHVNGQRFTLRQDAVAYAKAHSFPLTDVQRVATTAGEARRVGEVSQARRALASIKGRRRAADKAVVKAQRAVKDNPQPETRAALRYGEGNPAGKPAGAYLPNADIEAFLRSRGREPNSVAYLPHRQDVVGKRAHHAQFRPGGRPVLDAGETRTGEAFRRGVAETSTQLITDQGVRQRVQLNKAKAIDRLVSEHGLAHPALAKSRAGGALSPAEQRIVGQGGLFTAKEALEAAKRLKADTGQEMVPMVAHSGRLDAVTRGLIRQNLQDPKAMESLGQRLLNDRIVTPQSVAELGKGTRNVVLVPKALVDRLNEHLRPAGQVERMLQWLNKPFRYAVLPQFRWLTGNFVEPFFYRLPTVGSGLVNIPGLAVDFAAYAKGIKALRGGDAAMRQAAEEISSQQTGSGLFIGGGERGSVRRSPEEILPARAGRAYGRVVSKLPVVHQMAQMVGSSIHWLAAPLRLFFAANQHLIENPAQRAGFGHQLRKDVQALTGSWVKSITLGHAAVEDAMRGLVNTAAQQRFMHAQYELLGKYSGYSPKMRALVQTVAPFLPWMLNSLRFIFWTMPVHNTVKTSLLIAAQQTMAKDWAQVHSDTPPGGLRFAIPNGKGGWIDLARYGPYGAVEDIAGGGGFESVTNEFLPQFSGSTGALAGRDPFGNDLKVKPSAANPQGKPSSWQKVGIALNGLAEALVPGVSTARRLQEHGETAYGNSTVFSPQTKPGTSHGMSAVRRTFDPLRPTYLRSGSSEVVIQPRGGGKTRRPQSASSDPWSHVDQQPATQTQAASPWDLVK
jgi:hypothetical protein